MRLSIQVEAIIFKRTDGENQYLILKTIPERGGFWQPIAGGLEEGETKKEALKREIKEETGIRTVSRQEKIFTIISFKIFLSLSISRDMDKRPSI